MDSAEAPVGQEVVLQASLEMASFTQPDDVFKCLATSITKLLGGVYVAAARFDPQTGTFSAKAVTGIGPRLSKAFSMLAEDPLRTQYGLTTQALEKLHTAKLARFSGVHEITTNHITPALLMLLRPNSRLDEIYGIGLVSDGRIYGGVLIYLKKKTELHSAAEVEYLAAIASKAIARTEREQTLLRESRFYRHVLDAEPDDNLVFSPNGVVTYASPRFKTFVGRPIGDILKDDLRRIVDKETRVTLERTFGGLLRNKVSPVHLEFATGEKGSERFIVLTAYNMVSDPDVNGILVHVREVTDERRLEGELRHLSLRDSMTGVYNRAYFAEELNRLEGGRNYPITVISTDVDGLKLVNDCMGHEKGDELIKTYASVLQRAFRKSDVIARVGGDEFAVILPKTAAEAANRLASRLDEEIRSYRMRHREIPLSVSFGSATSYGPETPLISLLTLADKAMYADKIRHTTDYERGIIDALLDILALKDRFGEGHSSRVVELASMIGNAVGLIGKEISDLITVAAIHDLGKVGVPDEILLKPGPLTAEENEEVKQHSTIGYRIARSSPRLAHVAESVLSHHECWDGSGYPMGISGEDIPLASRLVAIADAYDSMTHATPYRPPLSKQVALAEIAKGAGSKFDPALVKAFMKLMSPSGLIAASENETQA